MRTICSSAAALAAILIALPAAAQTADGVTPSNESVCKSQVGRLKGLCNAYCQAADCKPTPPNPNASQNACDTLLNNYLTASGGRNPPCALTPEQEMCINQLNGKIDPNPFCTVGASCNVNGRKVCVTLTCGESACRECVPGGTCTKTPCDEKVSTCTDVSGLLSVCLTFANPAECVPAPCSDQQKESCNKEGKLCLPGGSCVFPPCSDLQKEVCSKTGNECLPGGTCVCSQAQLATCGAAAGTCLANLTCGDPNLAACDLSGKQVCCDAKGGCNYWSPK